MSKWDYLFETDRGLRQAERDYRSGKISMQEFAAIWVRAGEATRLRQFISNNSRQELKDLIGCPGDKCPPDFETEGEVQGYRLRLDKSTPNTRTHRLKIQCPVCGEWVGANAGKMGNHLKRRDHHGVNIGKNPADPPKRIGAAMHRFIDTKKYGVQNLYPEARVGWSGGSIYVTVNDDRDREALDKWMEEKYNLHYKDNDPKGRDPDPGKVRYTYNIPREYWFTR